ncbi:hypothetical protein B0H11DRAFT_503384 [Mycena galericulata]|nr:hypothetical protein B0H11DRAFT_503384 [Mycena galericulata]
MRMTTDPSTRCSMGDLPLALLPDFWSRVWPWIDFTETYREYLPLPGEDLSSYSSDREKDVAGLRTLSRTDAGSPRALLPLAPSLCAQKHIRQYFLDGALPEPGTVCPVIGTPFPTDVSKFGQRRHRRSCHFLRRIVASWKL